MKAVRAFLFVGMCLASTLALAQVKKEEQKSDADKKDTRVEPTSWGPAFGRVYDTKTGGPVAGATVSVETETGFVDKGRSVGVTDAFGGYKAEAILGRISSNFDIGRALLSSPLGLLFGGGTNTTKRIDVAQLCIRVTAPGYKPFEGVVAARNADAGRFRLDMEPILLVPEQDNGISFSATHWSAMRVVGVTVTPSVAKKGDKVKIQATVSYFGKDPGKNVELMAYCGYWGKDRKMGVSKDKPQAGQLLFDYEYKVSGKEKTKAEPVFIWISKSNLDWTGDDGEHDAVIQLSFDAKDDGNIAIRQEGLAHLEAKEHQKVVQCFKQLGSDPSANLFDLVTLADSAEKVGDYSTAADAWKRMTKDTAYATDQAARVMYLAKEYASVSDLVKPVLTKNKEKDWPKKVPAGAVGYYGLSLLKLNQIEDASKLNESLLNWPLSGLEESVIDFRGALRLAEVEAAIAKEPRSSNALADYGRALLDLGRYEEAISKLQASLEVNPEQPAVKRDLAWAALQFGKATTVQVPLTTAVEEAKAQLNLGDKKQRSKDFFAWNQYAVLLYALAREKSAASDPTAVETMKEAIDALQEALSLGRVGAKSNGGRYNYFYGYVSGSQVAISGFAYPEANASFALLMSIRRLQAKPDDALAMFCQAAALIDLNQLTLADRALQQYLSVRPSDPEAHFLAALIALRVEDNEAAKTQLQTVIDANGMHPRANLYMGHILAEEGDVAGAAERQAAHMKTYGRM